MSKEQAPKRKRGRPRKCETVEPPTVVKSPRKKSTKKLTKVDDIEIIKDSLKEMKETFSDQMKSLTKMVVDAPKNSQTVLIFNTSHEKLDRLKDQLAESSKSFFEINLSDGESEPTSVQAKDKVFKLEASLPDVKPKILKKFLPPIPKYKLREMEVLAAELEKARVIESSPSASCSLNLDAVTSTDPPLNSSTESQSSSTMAEQRITDRAKFYSMNAWLARKQPRWCVKTKPALNKMLFKEGLISTYKCMSRNCSYTTTSPKNFSKHLDKHETVSDVDSLYYCPYCFFRGDSASSVIDHYAVHQHDKYQCGYCFYRSANSQTCWEHVKSLHSSNPVIVYDCHPLLPAPENSEQADINRLHHKRATFVKPLRCSRKRLSILREFRM